MIFPYQNKDSGVFELERDAKLLDSDKKAPKKSTAPEEVKNNRKIEHFFKVIGDGDGRK